MNLLSQKIDIHIYDIPNHYIIHYINKYIYIHIK